LNDYRERHATYRSDLDLQLSHGSFPWIPVWDDHEVIFSFSRIISVCGILTHLLGL
jgi:phosphodiesterase/alkaline phosphatase D-like protein